MMTTLTSNDLGVLSCIVSHDKSGLHILAEVKADGTHLSLGSLYAILHRLEREGLVESYWGEATSERGNHRRRYYRITAQGALAMGEHRRPMVTGRDWSFAYSF